MQKFDFYNPACIVFGEDRLGEPNPRFSSLRKAVDLTPEISRKILTHAMQEK